MERRIEVEVSLNGLDIDNNPKFCQGDKNTHFIQIRFLEEMKVEGYQLDVYYLPPYPSTVPFVDTFKNLTQEMIIPITNKALERNGIVTVEFALSKGQDLITVNKNFTFEVIRTINGTYLTAYPEGELKLTIAQQIEKIKLLISQSQEKIDEYNENTVLKTQEYNNNSAEKLNAFNSNYEDKLKKINDSVSDKTTEFDTLVNNSTEAFNTNATEKMNNFNKNSAQKTNEFDNHVTVTLNTAYQELDNKVIQTSNEASELMKAQESKSIKAISDTGISEVEKITNAGAEEVTKITNESNTQKGLVVAEGTKQIDLVKKQGENDALKIQNLTTTEIEKVTTEGNKQLNAITTQGNTSKKLVEDRGLEVSNEAISAINIAKETAINEAKGNIDTYVEKTSKSNIDLHVNNTSKPEIDNYVETVSKESIDNYITSKESEIKGATFTPVIDEAGNLSFTNDKNLPNPPAVNLKGKTGEKGDAPIKGTDYYTEAEKQEFAREINDSITAEGNKQLELIKTKVNEITTTGDQKLAAITGEATKQLDAITKSGVSYTETLNSNIETITNLATEKVNAITQAGTTQTEAITSKGTEITNTIDGKITEINNAGTTQVDTINSKITEITSTAEEQITAITSEGTKQTTSVTNKGTEQAKLVNSEGSKQVSLVTSEGEKVLQEVKKIIGETPEAGNALTLGGKSRIEFDRELEAAVGIKRDEALVYLSDPGTKKKGYFYLDKLTPGIFECIKETTTTVNDSACFVNFSNKENSDKLGNLTETFETYDNPNAACLSGEPYKTVQINGKTKYIGFTKDLDAKKASMIHYKIDGEEYALRKYKGKTSMYQYFKRKYPNTYNTISDINDDMVEDTGDCYELDSFFYGCSSATSFPQLDTTNGTQFNAMFYGCKIRQATLNTEDGFNYNSMFYNCKELESVSDINLSSITIEQINNCLNNMFFNCEKLANIKFVECPVGTNADSLKQIIKVPSSCNVIVEERKPRTNFEVSKVIKVENMKLVEVDNNSGISIKRKDNKPLDSYIVNSGEWGTIYNDNESFRLFVTKDNLIYLGTAYNSSKRTEVQPEIPEGIEIPDSCLILEKEGDFKNVSFILKDFTPGFGQINQVNRYFPIEWGGPWIDYVPASYSPVDIYFSWKNSIMEIKSASQRDCMTKSYFKITVGSQFSKPNTTSAIYLFNDVLYGEEFDAEIKKIKQ